MTGKYHQMGCSWKREEMTCTLHLNHDRVRGKNTRSDKYRDLHTVWPLIISFFSVQLTSFCLWKPTCPTSILAVFFKLDHMVYTTSMLLDLFPGRINKHNYPIYMVTYSKIVHWDRSRRTKCVFTQHNKFAIDIYTGIPRDYELFGPKYKSSTDLGNQYKMVFLQCNKKLQDMCLGYSSNLRDQKKYRSPLE